MAQKGYSDQTMPELVAKMRTTASRSRIMTNGRSHHFFSREQNLKNSRKTVHMGAARLKVRLDLVEGYSG
jgi:hypothetical protein